MSVLATRNLNLHCCSYLLLRKRTCALAVANEGQTDTADTLIHM
jgi:hypothetical protein